MHTQLRGAFENSFSSFLSILNAVFSQQGFLCIKLHTDLCVSEREREKVNREAKLNSIQGLSSLEVKILCVCCQCTVVEFVTVWVTRYTIRNLPCL